jgi:DNA-binding transcriptional MocR family regulator
MQSCYIIYGMPTRTNTQVPAVFDALEREILSGRLKTGDRLPSEAELERRFEASRITVGRAVRDLQLAGMVERRAGIRIVRERAQPRRRAVLRAAHSRSRRDRDLRADLSGDDGVAARAAACLLWGSLPAARVEGRRARALCRQFIDRRVSGCSSRRSS